MPNIIHAVKILQKIGQIFSRNLFCMVSHHRTGHTKTKLAYMSYPRYQIRRHAQNLTLNSVSSLLYHP
jgi:hypothetical protein